MQTSINGTKLSSPFSTSPVPQNRFGFTSPASSRQKISNLVPSGEKSSDSSRRGSSATYTRESSLDDNFAPNDPLNDSHSVALEKQYSSAIGRKVCLGGEKLGTLRYFGPLHVAEGVFCGIELDQELGQHNGKVDGKRYFTAGHNRGIFAPPDKIDILPIDQQQNKSIAGSARLSSLRISAPSNATANFSRASTTTPLRNSGRSSSAAGEELLDDIEPHLMDRSAVLEEQEKSSLTMNRSLTFGLTDSITKPKHMALLMEKSMSSSQTSRWCPSDADEFIYLPEHSNGRELTRQESLPSSNSSDTNFLEAHINRFTCPTNHDAYLDDLLTPMNEAMFNNCLVDDSLDILDDDQQRHHVLSGDVPPMAPSPSCFTSTPAATLPKVNANDNTFSFKQQSPMSRTFDIEEQKDLLVPNAMAADVVRRQNGTVEKPNGQKDRPISTVSADTGYQGDTEYETQSGRSTSPPENYTNNQNHANANYNNEPINVDDVIIETVYRSKKTGRILKSVPSVLPNSQICVGPETSTLNEVQPSSSINEVAVVNPTEVVTVEVAELVQKAVLKTEPENVIKKATPFNMAKTGTVKNSSTVSKPAKLPLKKELELPDRKMISRMASNNSVNSLASGGQKKVDPVKKQPKPPPKVSKRAEIMAKLQQSIADEKNKPKKEAKSRVLAAVADASDSIRSHSRAGSVSASIPASPLDSQFEPSPAESCATEVSIVNNSTTFKKPVSKLAAKSNAKSLPVPKSHPVKTTNEGKVLPSKDSLAKRSIATPSSSRSVAKPGVTTLVSLASTSKVDQDQEKATTDFKRQLAMFNDIVASNARKFDALAIVARYLGAEVLPTVYQKLKSTQFDLIAAKDVSFSIANEKLALLEEMSQFKKECEIQLVEIEKNHKHELSTTKSTMQKQNDQEIQRLHSKLQIELQAAHERFTKKEEDLNKQFQEWQATFTTECDEKIEILKYQHVKDLEALNSALQKEKVELCQEFEMIRHSLEEKLANAINAREKYKLEAEKTEAALIADKEKKSTHISELISNYKNEIHSLQVVLDMRNSELHEFRISCENLKKELESFHAMKGKYSLMEQRVAELQDAVKVKSQTEKKLSQQNTNLVQTFNRELERSKNLSMTNEQLRYRLQQLSLSTPMSQSAYETPMCRTPCNDAAAGPFGCDDLSVSAAADFASFATAVGGAGGGDVMTQSLVQIYADSSPRGQHSGAQGGRSRHAMPVTVYTTDGVSKMLAFDNSSKKSSHKRRSASETSHKKLTSPVSGCDEAEEANINISAASEQSQSTLRNRRRPSPSSPYKPSHHLGASGANVLANHAASPPRTTSNGASFYLTDSGVFTGSMYRASSSDDALPQPNIREEPDFDSLDASTENLSKDLATPQ